MEFEVGDRVMHKVSPWKGVIRFGKRGKLNPRYVKPFRVLAKVGKVAYRLELPEEFTRVHHTFHMSNLKKCYADEPLVMPLEGIHVDDKLQFVEEPVEIMEREIKRLKRSWIPLVKVRWNSRRGPEFTWEHKDSFKKKYPYLFINQASSSTTRPMSVEELSVIDYVMSSAFTVTFTSVYTDSEPGRVFWGANEELSDEGSPRVIVYGYDGLPMQPVAPPSLDYVPGPEYPPSPNYVPGPEHPPSHVKPLPADASPVVLSPGYMADSDPEKDPKEDHADYPADRGGDDDEPSNDDDDNNDTDDEDEEPFEDEDDNEEEEEHLAPADSPGIPIVDHIPSARDRGI
ncbi:hypothetical protein Tco_1153155 [Tanacetum coccineum]